jgi:hypothetical protein
MGRILYCIPCTSPICGSAPHQAEGFPGPCAREPQYFDYTRQFNTLAQNGTYHVNTDEKKANLYRAGLTIHLQERLVPLSSLSYNELASASIDQERMMKAVVEANEKKRKRMMPESVCSGSSSGAPPKYCMVYTPPGGQMRRQQQQQNWGHRPQFQS